MKRFLFISLFILFTLTSFSQTKRVVPGAHYEAGWLHELFFGAHWRDVWTTPVKVDVVDMNTYGGGLTPLKRGGGFQTLSLRFKGADGKEYKFRSLDKDPSKVLPPDLQGSIAVKIVQDQISSSNPYAGFVVNEILKDVGVPHSDYKLVILPNDDKLGEFKKDFGGILGLMEIVPDTAQFEGSDKIISTVKLLDRFNKEYNEEVDAKEYLRARLMDIFFGDWDRHKDQWKWIRYEEGDKKIYKPFPLDRDQAFAEFDGILPKIGEAVIPQFNHFGHSFPDMKWMTWSGRYLDQRFLAFLDKYDWDKVTNEVYSKLTNELIDRAVSKLPPEVYGICRVELTEKLKSRRDELKEASNEYYELVNKVVDIYATDKDDYVRVQFLETDPDIGNVGVSLIDKKNDSYNKHTRYKVFQSNVTDEIRIYLLDGDDFVNLQSTMKNTNLPKIRIIGGEGKDSVKNGVDQTLLFYDDGKKSTVTGEVDWDKDKYKLPYEKLSEEYKSKKETLTDDDKEKYKEKIANLRYDPAIPPDKFGMSTFLPLLNYTPDIGLFFGGTYSYYKYGFRMNPYLYKLAFTAGYATKKKGITGLLLDFKGQFNGINKKAQLNVHLRKSGIEVNNYFGQGNETVYNDSLYNADYYKIQHEEYIANPYLVFGRDKKLQLSAGVIYKYFKIQKPEKDNIQNDILVENKYNILGFNTGLIYDKRDHPTAPFKGYFADLNVFYYPVAFEKGGYDFAKISGDIRGYIGHKTNIGLALRVFGEKVIGTYPRLESAFLGGSTSLRGYSSERFAGEGSVMGSAEVRFLLFNMFFLFPETVGLFAFGESGKVFLKDEESKKWHASYGGGLFMHVINRDITLRFTYARSIEKKMSLYFGTGFTF